MLSSTVHHLSGRIFLLLQRSRLFQMQKKYINFSYQPSQLKPHFRGSVLKGSVTGLAAPQLRFTSGGNIDEATGSSFHGSNADSSSKRTPTDKLVEIKMKIKAVELALGSFVDSGISEEDRRRFLSQKVFATPMLKSYCTYSAEELNGEMEQLREKEKELVQDDSERTRFQEEKRKFEEEKRKYEIEKLLYEEQQGLQTQHSVPLRMPELVLRDIYNHDGILSTSKVLSRLHLVKCLFDTVMYSSGHFVHLAAPPASGKTSLLQLLEQYGGERGVTFIHVSMLFKDFESILRQKTGISSKTWTVKPGGVCGDSSRNFVVMLDDAQERYSNLRLWTSLIKSARLPANLKFIISATYSLVTKDSPVSFNSLPKMDHNMRLSPEEADEFIELFSGSLENVRVGELLVDPVIRSMIITHCNGLIGALSVSMKGIVEHFFERPNAAVADVVNFYLSNDMQSKFERCYYSGVMSLPEDMRNCLIRCLTLGPERVSLSNERKRKAYRQLIRSGVLEEDEENRAKFTSPAAACFINDLIFPQRSKRTVSDIRKLGLFGLMKLVVARISGTTLRQFLVDSSTGMPSETAFQHLMLAPLEAETPACCSICIEPPHFLAHSQDSAVEEFAYPPAKRGCDFYLNGGLRWAIEILVSGRSLGEHLSRFEGDGKYVELGFADYVVVDFRVNATGIPTDDVQRHEHRITVFFKQGDFSFCNVLCGLNQPEERIELAN